MTITGTNHFVSFELMVKYYRDYGLTRGAVELKREKGEIVVGKPDLKPGQTLSIIDNGTRYAIEDKA